MSYRPSGPEGLRLIARFFEEVLAPHECFKLDGKPEVEEDLRRWADEMEQANEKITSLRLAVERKDRLIVTLSEQVQDLTGCVPSRSTGWGGDVA